MSTSQRRILIIESQADQWRLIRLNLVAAIPDCQADWVVNPSFALDYLNGLGKDQFPDLILLDLDLPRPEDGFDLMKALKQDALRQSVPLVVFSDSDQKEDIARAYQLGCSSYIIKPSDSLNWNSFFSSLMTYWELTP